ncbi:MAG TPA: isoprenylcysteine carboxylmethyltransferase family protein [Pyrinomonadaceae bacterium]|jgi:protein-S-isoprenylcysteine O-methyltransferase|nr:isoprenylcysteine carboxylmethyltransferase family protein [Pyrinomonadaceae bacterium]
MRETIFPALAVALRLLWMAAEGLHAMRPRSGGVREWDRIWRARHARGTAGRELERGSGRAWDVASLCGALGVVLWYAGVGRARGWELPAGSAGVLLMLAGLALRWAAIRTLGQYFERVINIQPGHEIVRRGLYRRVRHPSYTGALVAHFGFGLAFADWLTLAASFLPMLAAVLYRVRVEEDALRQKFGAEYELYSAHTKRLLPGIY